MGIERRRAFGWLLAALTALAIMALSSTIAAAHTLSVTRADPPVGSTVTSSPAQVMAQFSEEVVSQGSTFKVFDAGGKQVSQGDGKLDLNDPNHQIMLAALPNALPDGVYTVQYHIVATDGDATDDGYKFTVKAAADPAAQQAATSAPTVAPTGTPATAPTAAPATAAPAATVANVAAPVLATASPTAASPNVLPRTGAGADSRWLWPLAVGVLLMALGLTLALRRNDHV